MKIQFVISSLGAGGGERATAQIANAWAAEGHQVVVMTLSDAPAFYALHPAIRRVQAGLMSDSTGIRNSVQANLRRLRAIRASVRNERPDVVISVMDRTNVRTLLATLLLRTPVIVVEQIDPAMYPIGRVWSVLRWLTYHRAAALVLLTERSRGYFPRTLQKRIAIIPNPIAAPSVRAAGLQPQSERGVMAAMGRCVPQKGFDLLLRAFAQIAGRLPGWRLVVLGDGPDRAQLQELSRQLGIHEQVEFAGLVQEPALRLAQADLFVMSSRFEGFPLALGEALACGLPVISFDCPTGPREIVRDGIDGVLVPPADVDALAAAMNRLIAQPDLRAQMARRAPEVLDRFGIEPVMAEWRALVGRVAPQPQARQRAA